MCLSTPRMPDIKPPPAPPRVTGEEAQLQAFNERRRRSQAKGRASTILGGAAKPSGSATLLSGA